MAGMCEACFHVGAVLFALETAFCMRESITYTQKKSKWIMPGYVKEVPYMQISEMDFTSSKTKHKQLVENEVVPNATLPPAVNTPKTPIPATTCDEQLNFFNNIAACSTKPVILSLVPNHNKSYVSEEVKSLPEPLTSLFKEDFINLAFDELQLKCKAVTLKTSEKDAINVEFQTRDQSTSSVWFEQRSGRITASRLHAVCHTSTEKPSKSLIKGVCYPGAYKFSSAATKWGIDHEAEARTQYEGIMHEKHDGLNVSDSGFQINPKWPFWGASPDRVVNCNCCGKGLCEIKCPYSYRDSTIGEAVGSKNFYLQKKDTGFNLKKDHSYYYQVQMQINVHC